MQAGDLTADVIASLSQIERKSLKQELMQFGQGDVLLVVSDQVRLTD
jgi:hypothetical protein